MSGDAALVAVAPETVRTTSRPPVATEFRRRYGPWALVTGASDGIGRATTLALAQRGLDLVLVSRREATLDAFARELRTTHGVEVRVIAADLAKADEVERVVRASAELDLGLVVAAAGFGTSGPFIDSNFPTELEMADVNMRAVTALAWHAARRFARQRRGGIILFSSIVAFQGVRGAAHYSATKAFIQTLAEGLHEELAPLGVDVLASAPGPVPSGFGTRARIRITNGTSPRDVAEGTLEALGRTSIVRPGWFSKLLGWSLATLPRRLRVRVLGLVMGGMTAHHAAPSPP